MFLIGCGCTLACLMWMNKYRLMSFLYMEIKLRKKKKHTRAAQSIRDRATSSSPLWLRYEIKTHAGNAARLSMPRLPLQRCEICAHSEGN